MKILFLLRHGQAEDRQELEDDADRSLSALGTTHIRKAALDFKAQGIAVDRALVSNARRARQTAELFAHTVSLPTQFILIEPVLYTAPTIEPILKLIRKQPDDINGLLLVGHNPLLEDLTQTLCPAFADRIPPGAFLGIRLSATTWQEITPGTGEIGFSKVP